MQIRPDPRAAATASSMLGNSVPGFIYSTADHRMMAMLLGGCIELASCSHQCPSQHNREEVVAQARLPAPWDQSAGEGQAVRWADSK